MALGADLRKEKPEAREVPSAKEAHEVKVPKEKDEMAVTWAEDEVRAGNVALQDGLECTRRGHSPRSSLSHR